MTPDEIQQAREHLRQRISQARDWVNAGFPCDSPFEFGAVIGDEEYRFTPCKFVDNNDPDVDRKQAYGIRFEARSSGEPVSVSYVDVLLASEAKTNNRIMKGPWIKVKAVDQKEGSKVNSNKDIIAPYFESHHCVDEDSIDKFFKSWLIRALEHEKKEIILNYKHRPENHE